MPGGRHTPSRFGVRPPSVDPPCGPGQASPGAGTAPRSRCDGVLGASKRNIPAEATSAAMKDRTYLSRREFVAMTVGAAGGMLSGCVSSPYWYWEDVHSTDAAPIVIIGSGVTGLCLGGLLARAGHSVVILEAHPSLVGGHARILDVGGVPFSAGPQYLCNFGQDDVGSRVLRYLGDASRVPLESMDPDGFDNIVSDDALPFAIPLGVDRWRESLVSRHPEAEHSIERFFEIYDALLQGLRVILDQGLYLQGFADMWTAVLLSPRVSAHSKDVLNTCVRWTLKELLDWCEMPVPPRRLLYGQAGLFTESIDAVSAAIYVAATGYLHDGVCVPRDGFGSLVEYLTDACTSNGGDVYLNKRVTHLRVDGTRVCEVQCADGSAVPCSFVVSNLAPGLTCSLFSEPSAYRLRRYEPSRSAVCCYFTLSGYDSIVPQLARRNYWYQASDGDVEFAPTDISQPPRYLYIGSNTRQFSESGSWSATPPRPDRMCPGEFCCVRASVREGGGSLCGGQTAGGDGCNRHSREGSSARCRCVH